MTLAALYARVSTDKQEREATVESQLDALRRAAAARGLAVLPEYEFVDERASGARLDRPALDRLRDLAAEGAFEVVLVAAPDRLARQYAYQVVVLEELARVGCEVVFLNHAFGETPEQQMLLQIQGVFAEYERALIHERLRRGRLYAARQGRVTWGQAPYGDTYRRKTESTPQQLVVNEGEAEVVRQVYRWLLEEQLSCYAIALRLAERGVPTRRGTLRHWQQSTVFGLVRNPVYKGEAHVNRTMSVDARRPSPRRGFTDLRPGNRRGRALRPREEWIPVRVPALVDPETWELAQAQLVRNRERSPRNNTRHPYLLRGLLVCGRCGRRLVGSRGLPGTTSGRYVCPARAPRQVPWHCDGASVSATKLEPQIWAYVRDLLGAPEVLRAKYEAGRADPAVEGRDAREQERLERKLRALEREVQRLIDAYQADVIELPELRERRQRIDDHGRALRERLAELRQHRVDREHDLRLLQGLDEFCASVRGALADPPFAVKQQVLQLVVDRIVVEDAQVTVHHVVPTGPVRLQTEQKWCTYSHSTCSRCRRPRISSQSKHSRRTVPTQRSANAFARGARTGVRTTRTASAVKTASNANENFASRSRRSSVGRPPAASSAHVRSRACWVAHAAVGCAVQPARNTRRVCTWRKNRT